MPSTGRTQSVWLLRNSDIRTYLSLHMYGRLLSLYRATMIKSLSMNPHPLDARTYLRCWLDQVIRRTNLRVEVELQRSNDTLQTQQIVSVCWHFNFDDMGLSGRVVRIFSSLSCTVWICSVFARNSSAEMSSRRHLARVRIRRAVHRNPCELLRYLSQRSFVRASR